MKLLLIDVETANAKRSSICQVGWMVVKNDEIVKAKCSYINPNCEFSARNIDIHGIKPGDVESAPDFVDYYKKRLKKRLSKYLILAHNASFDLSAIAQALTAAGEQVPEMLYVDTLDVCRAAIDTGGNGYKLTDLAREVGFDYKSHDALEDCRALLAVLEYARDQLKHDDLISLIIHSRAPIRVYGEKSEKQNASPHEGFSYTYDTHFRGMTSVADEKLKNLHICLTGDCACPREEVERLIAKHGGKATMQPSRRTDILVIGTYHDLGDDFTSAKQRKCEELNSDGASIRFITFEKLFEMMGEEL